MKITLVMASDEEGGLEKHVLELAAGLSQSHEVSLIAHQKYKSQVKSAVNFVAFDMSGSRYNPWTKYRLKKINIDDRATSATCSCFENSKTFTRYIE